MVVPDPTSLDIGPELVKSESDKKTYRLIHLSSGLRVLLIHDPPRMGDGDDKSVMPEKDDEEHESVEANQKAAVALAVGVGSFCDPPDCEGLAHYCEHGLFMGSKKFLEENEYEAYVSRHGGSVNAMTETEYTVFYFDVVPPAFEGALDRFAQCFVEPLLRRESCSRELHSIDEEFSLSRNMDDCRLQELRCHTSVDDHPCRKFCWGNTTSLMTAPQSKGVDVAQSLIEFHQRYYKAPLMQLCVLGTQKLDELQEMVCRYFSGLCFEPVSLSEIENQPPGAEVCWKYFGNGQQRSQYLSFLGAGMPFKSTSPMVYRVRPVKDTNKLILSWQLPPQGTHYRSDPSGYLAHVVGHEGRGSLYSAIQAKGWATEKGMNHWENIIGLFFSLLSLLRKDPLPRWIQDEMHRISYLSFRFVEEAEPIDCVGDLVTQMLPTLGLQEEHIICARYMLDEWRPELVKEILDLLVPGSIRVEILSTQFGRAMVDNEENEKMMNHTDVTTRHTSLSAAAAAADTVATVLDGRVPLMEPYFGVEYWVDPIPKAMIASWENIVFNVVGKEREGRCETDGGLDLAAAVELSLPEPNMYIPEDVTVKPLPVEHKSPLMETLEIGALSGIRIPKTSPPAPEIVWMQCSPSSIVWYLQDSVFMQPKAEARIKISFKEANTSAENSCYRDLLALLVKDSLTDDVYPASLAELHYSLKSRPFGFYLSFSGFNDKLLALAETVLKRLLDFESHLKSLQFEAQREILIRSIKNANLNSGNQVTQERRNVLADRFWMEDQKLVATKALTLENMKLCLSRFFRECVRIEALVHGNITQDDARALSAIFEGACSSDRLSVLRLGLQLPPNEPRDVVIPLGTRLVRVTRSKNQAEPNALEMYYQIGHDNSTPSSTRCRILLDVVEALMEEPIFDELRTKQQLGYSSDSHNGLTLVERVQEFIKSFSVTLSTMDSTTFSEQVSSLARLKVQRDNEISDETYRHWKEISIRRHRFHSRFASARSLADVSQDEVCCFFNQWFLDGGNSAGMLTTLVNASKERSHDEMATSIATVLEANEVSVIILPETSSYTSNSEACFMPYY